MNNMNEEIGNDEVEIIKLTENQLKSSDAQDLKLVSQGIEKAFGINGIGFLLVTQLSKTFEKDRNDLLSSGRILAKLPEEELKELEVSEIDYLIGWGRGHESFNGKIDMKKGSFYANPIYDEPSLGDNKLYEKYPYVYEKYLQKTYYQRLWKQEKRIEKENLT